MPHSREEWTEIANEFASKWNCPHCVSTLDSKICTDIRTGEQL